MNLKLCPLMGKECQYSDCMLFDRSAAQCGLSVIASELQSVSTDIGRLADSLNELNGELENVTSAVKGLV